MKKQNLEQIIKAREASLWALVESGRASWEMVDATHTVGETIRHVKRQIKSLKTRLLREASTTAESCHGSRRKMSKTKKKRKQHPRLTCPCGGAKSQYALRVHRKVMCSECIKAAGLSFCGEHGDWFGNTGECITCIRVRRQPAQPAQVQAMSPDDSAWLKSIGVEVW